jgi:hypothetical protein
VTEDDKQPAAERLLKAREAAAAEFKLDIDDWRTRRLAMLQAVYAQAEDMLANGRSVDISGLLSLDKAIQEVRESIKKTEPMSVNVTFTEGVRGIYKCKHCGQENELKEGEYTPPSKPPAPLPSQSCASEADKPNAALSTPAPANVVPLPERPRNPSMAKFNAVCGYSIAKDGGLAKGPATGRIDRLAEPDPAREAAHPLPSPPPGCFK